MTCTTKVFFSLTARASLVLNKTVLHRERREGKEREGGERKERERERKREGEKGGEREGEKGRERGRERGEEREREGVRERGREREAYSFFEKFYSNKTCPFPPRFVNIFFLFEHPNLSLCDSLVLPMYLFTVCLSFTPMSFQFPPSNLYHLLSSSFLLISPLTLSSFSLIYVSTIFFSLLFQYTFFLLFLSACKSAISLLFLSSSLSLPTFLPPSLPLFLSFSIYLFTYLSLSSSIYHCLT